MLRPSSCSYSVQLQNYFLCAWHFCVLLSLSFVRSFWINLVKAGYLIELWGSVLSYSLQLLSFWFYLRVRKYQEDDEENEARAAYYIQWHVFQSLRLQSLFLLNLKFIQNFCTHSEIKLWIFSSWNGKMSYWSIYNNFALLAQFCES